MYSSHTNNIETLRRERDELRMEIQNLKVNRALSGVFGRRQFSATQRRSLAVGCTSLSIAQ